MSASRLILILDKLVKIITVCNRMLTICENLGKGQPHCMPCKKKDMDGCTLWMKIARIIQFGWQEEKQSIWDIYSKNCIQCKMSETTQRNI